MPRFHGFHTPMNARQAEALTRLMTTGECAGHYADVEGHAPPMSPPKLVALGGYGEQCEGFDAHPPIDEYGTPAGSMAVVVVEILDGAEARVWEIVTAGIAWPKFRPEAEAALQPLPDESEAR